MLINPGSSSLRCLLALLCLCCLRPALYAQSTESDIKTRLMDKPLYLRGCWSEKTLRYDSIGQFTGKPVSVSFTLCGFDLKSVLFKPSKLLLEGRRVGLEMSDHKLQRIPLNGGDPNNFKDEPVHIEIAASPTGDYGPALDAVFINGLADMVPLVPLYWKPYASTHFIPNGSAIDQPTKIAASDPSPSAQPSSPDAKPYRVGGGVTMPTLLRVVEPKFNEEARRLKLTGNTLVHLWVTPQGTTTNISIVRPLGLGLDEQAVAAVQNYSFSPAKLNGNPVLVELNIEVNFQIF
jgi:TonB family protein